MLGHNEGLAIGAEEVCTDDCCTYTPPVSTQGFHAVRICAAEDAEGIWLKELVAGY